MGVDLEILSMEIIRMGPPDRNTVKGLFFKGVGARSLGIGGRARQDECLGSWYERLDSSG